MRHTADVTPSVRAYAAPARPRATPEEVANEDHGRGPHGPSQGVVEEEGGPSHPAYASDQCPEDPQAREEAGQEDGLAPCLAEKASARASLSGVIKR
jgi:hypothetical protein